MLIYVLIYQKKRPGRHCITGLGSFPNEIIKRQFWCVARGTGQQVKKQLSTTLNQTCFPTFKDTKKKVTKHFPWLPEGPKESMEWEFAALFPEMQLQHHQRTTIRQENGTSNEYAATSRPFIHE